MTPLAHPRMILGAERGGVGKTTLSLGLLAAWSRRGWACAPFKKGPDYIDAAWLTAASGRPCRNLDTWLMGEEEAARSFQAQALEGGLNLIEGNRGLFDGVDAEGSFSTAELAKLLDAPVVLVVDAEKRTRTAAAVVLGARTLDPELRLAGVILNRLGTARQERVARAAIERSAGVPVLGALPRLGERELRERHLGLVPPQEQGRVAEAVAEAAEMAERYLDVAGLREVALGAGEMSGMAGGDGRNGRDGLDGRGGGEAVRLGVFRDVAFHFYYPENLEALEAAGARLTEIDALGAAALPSDLDGLYIGGGFPESRAAELAANTGLRESVRRAAAGGMPVYAECGGLLYLARRLRTAKGEFPMAGVFPVDFVLENRPQGHGYAEAVCLEGHPFFEAGTRLKGHEFHYTRAVAWDESARFTLRFERGRGVDAGRDGLTAGGAFGTYLHLHALGEPAWAGAVVERCRAYRRAQSAPAGVGSGVSARDC